jgi:hypothetical protein
VVAAGDILASAASARFHYRVGDVRLFLDLPRRQLVSPILILPRSQQQHDEEGDGWFPRFAALDTEVEDRLDALIDSLAALDIA